MKSTVVLGPHKGRPLAYLPGEEPEEWKPGDLILTHDPDGFFGRLIRFGQRLRYRGELSKYAWFNHVAVVISPDGDIVEALSHGIVRKHASRYRSQYYAYVDTGLSDAQRTGVAQYALRASEVNTKYGWTQIVSISLSILTGGSLNISMGGENICSGLAAEALRSGGYWFERDGKIATSSFVMPADLAHAFSREK